MSGDHLTIPAVFFMDKVIPLNKLFSCERVHISGNETGVWLGIRNAQGIVLDRSWFVKNDDYTRFADCLETCTRANLTAYEYQVQLGIVSQTRKPEYVVLLAIVLVWSAMYWLGSASLHYLEIGETFLVAGANIKGLLAAHEYYRLFTAFFLHGSILHLLLNTIVLAQLGHALVRMIGAVRFLNILLLTSLVGTLASSVYSPSFMSIGASGGLYGLFAAYACLKSKFNNYLPAAVNSASMAWLVGVLSVDLLCALFLFRNIDVVNHVSGFAAGICWCLLTHPGLKIMQPVCRSEVIFCVVLVGLYGYALFHLLQIVWPSL